MLTCFLVQPWWNWGGKVKFSNCWYALQMPRWRVLPVEPGSLGAWGSILGGNWGRELLQQHKLIVRVGYVTFTAVSAWAYFRNVFTRDAAVTSGLRFKIYLRDKDLEQGLMFLRLLCSLVPRSKASGRFETRMSRTSVGGGNAAEGGKKHLSGRVRWGLQSLTPGIGGFAPFPSRHRGNRLYFLLGCRNGVLVFWDLLSHAAGLLLTVFPSRWDAPAAPCLLPTDARGVAFLNRHLFRLSL